MKKYNKLQYLGILIIVIGIILTSLLDTGTIGLGTITLGGLFFIISISNNQEKNKD